MTHLNNSKPYKDHTDSLIFFSVHYCFESMVLNNLGAWIYIPFGNTMKKSKRNLQRKKYKSEN